MTNFVIIDTIGREIKINPFGLIEVLNPKEDEHPKRAVGKLKKGDIINFQREIYEIKEIQKPFIPFAKEVTGPVSKVKTDDDDNIKLNLNDNTNDDNIIEKVEEEIKRQSDRLEKVELIDDSE